MRGIRSSDLSSVHLIDTEAFGDQSYPPAFFRQALELFPSTFLCVGDEASPVGYVLAEIGEDRTTGWILSLAVTARSRRTGVGSLLLREVLRALDRSGCTNARLSVHPGNVPAKSLFSVFGFVVERFEGNYFGASEPREIMVLELDHMAEQ